MSASLIFVGVMLATSACTSQRHTATTPARSIQASVRPPTVQHEDEVMEGSIIEVEPMRIQVIQDEDGTRQVVVSDARSLFDEGNEALANEDYVNALALYDEVLRDFPESSLSVPTLFNSGLALEGMQELEAAVERYLALGKIAPVSKDGIEAQIRASALYAEHQLWPQALGILDALLSQKALAAPAQIEARARRGYVLLEARDYAGSEAALEQALRLVKAHAALQDSFFSAMATFYLGDIPRRQFDLITIRLPESQMQRDLEAKASLIELAEQRYGNTIETGNIYWASAAGFRLAQMKHNFWRALVGAPLPPQLGQQAAKLYVEEVHKTALSLLESSIRIHTKNVQLATLYKTNTEWSEASATALQELVVVAGQERAGRLTELHSPEPPERAPMQEYLPRSIDL